MQGVIRIGDKLSRGGQVLSGHAGLLFMGIAVACVGDKVYCDQHGEGEIVEGDWGAPHLGSAIALHGHRCSCGCTLLSSLPQAGRG